MGENEMENDGDSRVCGGSPGRGFMAYLSILLLMMAVEGKHAGPRHLHTFRRRGVLLLHLFAHVGPKPKSSSSVA